MADDIETTGTEGPSADHNLQTLDALHLDGKGAPTLDDADERSLADLGDTRPEDVTGNANVQSAGRTTFEQMVQGGIREQAAVPTGDQVVVDIVQPTSRDNTVEARFDNVQPTFAPVPDLPAPEARPQSPAPGSFAPDPVITRPPEVLPAADALATDGAPAAAPVAEAPAPEAPLPQPEPAPADEEVIPKVADAPRVLAGAGAGVEDNLTKLDITVATNDQDGGSETITAITIANVPAGFTFVDSQGNAVGVSLGGGIWSFVQADLTDLYLRQPGDYSGDLQLTVSATSTEGNGSTATTTTVVPVHVEAVADMPTLGVRDTAGMEDTAIALDISAAATDVDGSESVKVYVENVPAGAVLNHGTQLTQPLTVDGHTFAAGTWVLDPAQGDLAGLTITPAANDSDDFTLQVASVSTEGQNGATALHGPLALKVDVGIEAPVVSGSGAGFEGQWSTLSLQGTITHDLPGDQETLRYYIEEPPAGVQLRFGDGATLPSVVTIGGKRLIEVTGHLDDTQVRWADSDSNAPITVTLVGVVDDGDGDTALGQPFSDWNMASAEITVALTGQAQAPGLATVDVAGMEDTSISLAGKITPAWVGADASEDRFVYISGVPAGAKLMVGGHEVLPESVTLTHTDASGSSAVLDLSAGYKLSPADLSSLAIIPADKDSADFTLTVYAAQVEKDGVHDAAVSAAQTINVDVGIVAPTVAGSGSGFEGQWTTLDLTQTINHDLPGDQETLKVYLEGVPSGVSLQFSDGQPVPYDSTSGRYDVTGHLNDVQVRYDDADAHGTITFTVHGIVHDTDAGTGRDTPITDTVAPDWAQSSAQVSVTVGAQADAPGLTVEAAAGMEDSAIAIGGKIHVTWTDNDSSESHVVYIQNVPAGSVLKSGGTTFTALDHDVTLTHVDAGGSHSVVTIPAGSYVVTEAQLGGLTITPPANDSADFTLKVVAASSETSNGDSAVSGTALDLPVDVGIVAPTVAGSGSGFEGQWTTLDLTQTINHDLPGDQETLKVYLEGVPSGVSLQFSDGQPVPYDSTSGRYDVTGHLNDVQVRYDDADAHGTITFTVHGIVHDTDAGTGRDTPITDTVAPDWAQSSAQVSVTVGAQADAPGLTVEAAAGMEDSAIAIGGKIHVTWTDNDSSESHVVYIQNVPAGSVLKSGGTTFTALDHDVTLTHVDAGGSHSVVTIPAGSYVVTEAQLGGLTITPPANDSADFTLKVVAASSETSNGDSAVSGTALDLPVDVGIVAPTVAGSGSGFEGQWTTVNLTQTVNHDLPSNQETLEVYLEGVPSGVSLRFSNGQPVPYDSTSGRYNVTGHLNDVQVKYDDPDANAPITFTVHGIVHDTDAGTGRDTPISDTVAPDWAQSSAQVTVTLTGQAHAPTLSTVNVGGMEDTVISLAGKINPVWSGTDASEDHVVYITGLPSGAQLLLDGVKLDPVGSVTLTHTGPGGSSSQTLTGAYRIDPADLDKLAIKPAANDSTDFTLNVTAAQVEQDGTHDAQVATATVRVDVGIEAPLVSGSGHGLEGQWTTLSLSGTITHDHPSPQESLSVYIQGVPAGAEIRFANGTSPSVVWINGVKHYDVTGHLNDTQVRWTDGLSDVDMDLTVRAIVKDTDAGTNPYAATKPGENTIGDTLAPDWNDATYSFTVAIDAVAQGPGLTAQAIGLEDKWVDIDITDTLVDPATQTLGNVYIQGLPAGLYLADSQGNPLDAASHHTSSAITLTSSSGSVTIPAGAWVLSPAELSGLRIYGLTANSDADISGVKVTAATTELGGLLPDGTRDVVAQASGYTRVNVSIPVYADADVPTLVLDGGVAGVVHIIEEDDLLVLDSSVVDAALGEPSVNGWQSSDQSETLTIRIRPVEQGERLLLNDTEQALKPGGYWEVSAKDILDGKVSIGGIANWATSGNDRLHFDVMAVATESEQASSTVDQKLLDAGLTSAADPRALQADSGWQTLTLQVTPKADKVTLTATATGDEDTAIAFEPRIQLKDLDGSETVADVTITSTDPDLINGKLIFNGVERVPEHNADGSYTWTFSAGELTPTTAGSKTDFTLKGLVFQPAAHSAGDVGENHNTTITVITQDSNGDTMPTTADVSIDILKVADAPIVTVGGSAAAGQTVHLSEDLVGMLNLDARLVDGAAPDPETLSSAQLSGVPEGWMVGYRAPDGLWTAASVVSKEGGFVTYTIDPARIGQVAVRGPSNLHVSAADAPTLTFTATSSETGTTGILAGHESASTSLSFKLAIDAVADAPNLLVTHARTFEDTAVRLDIRALLTDTDQSEAIGAVYIKGSAGATYWDSADVHWDAQSQSWTGSAHAVGVRGTLAADGTWTDDPNGLDYKFTAGQLGSLFLLPKHDSNVDLVGNDALTVVAQSVEGSNGSHAETSASLQVLITGVSDGVVIDAGYVDANGRLIAHGVEDQAVDGSAHAGAVIDPGFGHYHAVDTDGSETLSIVLRDVPANVGVEMVAGYEKYLRYIGRDADGNTQWAIDPTDDALSKVRFTTPANYAGKFDVELELITTEDDGASASSLRTLTVDVAAVTDKPSLSLSGSGTEDQGAPVAFTIQTNPADTTSESPEHISQITINIDVPAGIPAGTLKLHLGGEVVTVDGGVEFTIKPGDALWSNYDPATGKLTGLSLEGLPNGWSRDIPVTVTATSVEDIDGTAAPATNTVTGKIVIEARADAPTWSLDAAGGGTVDHPVSLDLSATLNDPDGSESIYFIVEDVPDGVILNHGYNNGDGTWTVPYTPGVPGWSLTATSHYTGQAALKVTAVVVDHDPDGGADTKVSEAKTFNLTITDPGGTGGGEWSALNPVAPTLAGDPQAGTEDVPFGLGGVAASGGTGNDALSALVVVDLPAGAQVVGTTDGNGAAIAWYNPITGHWTVDPNHLADFKVVADEDASGPVFLDIRAATLNGGATTGHVNVVDLAPVTDGGSFSMAPVGPVAEDSPKVPVTLTLTQADDDHSESLATDQVTIKNLTPGAKLYYDSGNGPVLLTADGDGTYHLPIPGITGKASTTLSGLYVEPPAQFSGKVSFTVGTVFQEAGSALQVPVSQTFSINVAPVVDTPTITVADHTGAEDSAISLHATINAPDVIGAGQYGSEYLSVIIGGVPDGAGVLGATYNNDHTWTVKSGNIELVNGQATLKNVSIVPPQDYSGTIHLSIKTYTLESSDRGLGAQSDYATFDLHVTGVADVPTANPVGRAGDEDAVVALDFDAELIDTSETISVIVRGVPTDATRAGAPFVEVDEDGAPVRDAHGDYIPVGVEIQVDANGDPLLDPATHLPLAVTGATHTGVWWIAAADVAKVGFMGPVDVSGTIAMTVQTMSQDDDSVALGNRMPFTVRLDGVADTPTLTIADLAPADDATQAAGTEDGDIAVGIAALVTDVTNDGPDGETVEVLITGAPAGTLFVTAAGQTIGVESDGWWHIPSAALDGLAVRPPADYDQDFTLRVVAKTTEGDTTAVSAEQTLAVHVAAENDAATGRVIGAPGWSVTAGQWDEPLRVIPDGDGSGASFDITDVDGSGLSKVEVAIGSAKAGDTLGLEGVGVVRDGQGHLVVQGTDIQVSYDAATHTLTFTGAASHAQYEALVEKVILSTTNTSGALAAGNRSIGITLYDDAVPPTASTVTTNANVAAGSFLSAAALGTVAWNADGTIHNFAEGGTLSASGGSGIEDVPLKLTLDAALADGSEKGFVILGDLPDGAVLVNGQGAAIGMEVQVQNGQVVLDANHNPVAATTHTGVWAVSVGQAGNVYFQGAHDQAGSWTLTAQVLTIDGASTQAGPVSTLQVALADDAPHLAATGTAQDPVTGDSHGVVAEPVHVLPDDATLTVADVNGTMLSGMRIEIAAGPAHSGDGLGLSGHDIALDANGHFVIDGTDIQVSYENGVLSFNGDASTATYADLAKSVVLANGGPLVAGDRTFGITLFDEQHQASNLLTTTVTIDDSAKTLSPEAQGDVTFNASGSAVLNCGDGDDTVHMHAGLAYDTVNGNGGTDTLMMDIGTGQPGDWVFLVDGSDLTLVAATDHSQTLGVIHIDTPGAVPAGIDGHTVDGVVFNGSVNGTIEFTDHSVVAFHNIEKLGAG